MAKVPRADLLDLFLQESEACLPAIRQALAVVKTEMPATTAVQGLCRLLQNLGRTAERVQLIDLSRAADLVATLLTDLADEELPLSARLLAALEQTVDLVEDFIWKKSPTPEDEVNLYARIALLFAEFSGSRPESPLAMGDGRGWRRPAGRTEYRQAAGAVLPLMLELAGYLAPERAGGKAHSARIYEALGRGVATLAEAARVARMAQQRRLLEEFSLLLEDIRSGPWPRQPELPGLILEILEFLAVLTGGSGGEDSDAAGRVGDCLRSLRISSALLRRQFAETPHPEQRREEPEPPKTLSVEKPVPEQGTPASRPEEAEPHRLSPEDLEELQGMEDELAAARNAMARMLDEFSDTLQELDRLRGSLRQRSRELAAGFASHAFAGITPRPKEAAAGASLMGIGPAELDRCLQIGQLIESSNDIAVDFNVVYATLAGLTGEIGGALCKQQLTMRLLRDKLARLRIMPMSAFSPALFQTVRESARKLNKKATLVIGGEDLYLDRFVWAKLLDPLNHLLKVAVDQGIDAAKPGLATANPAIGTIRVEAEQGCRSVILRVTADRDGTGLEPMPADAPGSAAPLGGGGLLDLDAIRGKIRELGGAVRGFTTPGAGLCLEVELPGSMPVTRAVMVAVAGKVFAVPRQDITQVKWFGLSELEPRRGLLLRLGDDRIPVVNLGYLLQLEERADRLPAGADGVLAILFQRGDRQTAVSVSEVIDQRPILVRSLGSHLTHVPGVSGVTLSGDGVPIPILDLWELTGRWNNAATRGATP